jgi:hypothetical protein
MTVEPANAAVGGTSQRVSAPAPAASRRISVGRRLPAVPDGIRALPAEHNIRLSATQLESDTATGLLDTTQASRGIPHGRRRGATPAPSSAAAVGDAVVVHGKRRSRDR